MKVNSRGRYTKRITGRQEREARRDRGDIIFTESDDLCCALRSAQKRIDDITGKKREG